MQCAEKLMTEFSTRSIFRLGPKGNLLSSSERIQIESESFTLLKPYCTVEMICLYINNFAH